MPLAGVTPGGAHRRLLFTQQTLSDGAGGAFGSLEKRIVAVILEPHSALFVDEHQDGSHRPAVLRQIPDRDHLIHIQITHWKVQLVLLDERPDQVWRLFVARSGYHLETLR